MHGKTEIKCTAVFHDSPARRENNYFAKYAALTTCKFTNCKKISTFKCKYLYTFLVVSTYVEKNTVFSEYDIVCCTN